MSIPYQKANNLPCVLGKVYNSDLYAFCAPTMNADSTKDLKRAVCVTDQANTNLTGCPERAPKVALLPRAHRDEACAMVG